MRHWLLLLVAGIVPAPCRAGAPPCGAPSEAEIAALFTRWNQSLQSGNAGAVLANYAPTSVLLAGQPHRPYLSAAQKRAYFRRLLRRHPSAAVTERRIESDCDTALDAGTYTLRFADGSAQATGYSISYQRFGRRWLIVSDRSAALAPPAAPSAAAPSAAGSP